MVNLLDTRLHCTRIPHCAVCRQRFETHSSFRSFVVINDRYYDPILTRPISFQEDNDTIDLQDLPVIIHKYPQSNFRNAPSVHVLCWKAANISNICGIYDLGRTMAPLVWTNLPPQIYIIHGLFSKAVRALVRHASTCIGNKTPLFELLKGCANLPIEITTIIWDFITPCTIKSLIALQATKGILSGSSHDPGGCATICLFGDIRIYHTRVIHGTYICGIRHGYTLLGQVSSFFTDISVPSSVAIFMCTFGIYGLQRLDFFTDTQLGLTGVGTRTTNDKTFLILIHPRLGMTLRVNVEWDALKITAVRYDDKSLFGRDFMWESEVPWVQTSRLSPDFFYDWPRHFDFATQCQRFMAYIPLHRNDSSLYGLTAFCSSEGFVGLGTHFSSYACSIKSYWYGKQYGCPVHVQLGSSETIRSVDVFWHKNDATYKTYLAVSTNKDRVLTLGPCFPPLRTATKNIFQASAGDISGLYYNSSPGITAFKSLGAIYQPRDSSLHREYEHSMPELQQHAEDLHRIGVVQLLQTSPFTAFSSRASLGNVKSIKACYVGSRYTGLLLFYNDNTTDILGQWYEVYVLHGYTLRFYFKQRSRYCILVKPGSICINIAYGGKVFWAFSEWCDIIDRPN
ncbi:hypothetical protein BDV25DRAFT_170056 [Aspergillus avenaceus]|uniref:Uncharacterized protein n=1 Tax=Aspergillus avenaceus TaxID=36643 RepID=A0A5N6TI45_ASPAV|nr:hypothetical protein BDV25DRAFT_170056 [Aspergillus avenaceus]